MNRFLAKSLGTLNAIVAGILLLATVIFAIFSVMVGIKNEGALLGAVAGVTTLVGGLIVTTMLCGVIAVLIDIRNILQSTRTPTAPTEDAR